MGSDLRVDQQRNLRHRHAQDGRCHLAQHTANTRMRPRTPPRSRRQTNARCHANFDQGRHLHAQLQHAAHHHTHGQRIHRLNATLLEHRRQKQSRADGAHIEQHRRDRGHRKAAPGVEDAGTQGHQRHEANVGKHPARHDDRRIKPTAFFQARGHEPDQDRRTHHAHHTGQRQGREQHGAHGIDQVVRGLIPSLGAALGQNGHEGLRKSTLGKQAAQQIGNAERHIEGIGGGAGAKGRGDQQLPNQAGDA